MRFSALVFVFLCTGCGNAPVASVQFDGPQLNPQTSVDPFLLDILDIRVMITQVGEPAPLIDQTISVGEQLTASLTAGDWIFDVEVTSPRATDGDRIPVVLLRASQRETLGPGPNPITINDFTDGFDDGDALSAWDEYISGRDPAVPGPGPARPVLIPTSGATITPTSVVRAKFFRPMTPGSEVVAGTLSSGVTLGYTWLNGDTTLEIRPTPQWASGAGQDLLLTVSDLSGPSEQVTATYVVDDPAATPSPSDGSVIGPFDEVVLFFDESINQSAATNMVSGALVDLSGPTPTMVWDNDTTLRVGPPMTGWADTSGTPLSLRVDVETSLGAMIGVVFSFVVDASGPGVVDTTPGAATSIPPRSPILIEYDESIQSPVEASGNTLGAIGNFTINNGTDLLLEPATVWDFSGGVLSVEVTDDFGNVSTTSISFGVSNEVYVSTDGIGFGTRDDPVDEVGEGLALCDTSPTAPTDCVVHVAQGVYSRISLTDAHVDIIGGYNPTDWLDRDPAMFETTVVGEGGNPAVLLDGVESLVVLDGLTIVGGGPVNTTGVTILSGVNVIRNCVVSGGGGTGQTVAIDVRGLLNEISANVIMGGSGVSSFGIVTPTPSSGAGAIIINNLIGDTSAMTGVVASGDVNLINNTILGGAGANSAVRIDEDGPSIINNIFLSVGVDTVCVEGEGLMQRPVNLNNNAFLGCDTYYDDQATQLTSLTGTLALVGNPSASLGNDLSNTDQPAPFQGLFLGTVDYSVTSGDFRNIDFHFTDCFTFGDTVCSGGTADSMLDGSIPTVDKDGITRSTVLPSMGAYESN